MMDPQEKYLEQAADCAERALAANPDNYSGLFLRGLVAGIRGQTILAIATLYRAHRLAPADPNVLAEFCRFGHASGIDVENLVHELTKLDPLTPVTWLVVATNGMLRGRNHEVAEAAQRVVSLAPGVSMLHVLSAWALAQAGASELAIELLKSAEPHLRTPAHLSFAVFLRHAFEGDAEKACGSMTPHLKSALLMVDFCAHAIAGGYALLGRADEALEWIRNAMNNGFANYPFIAEHNRLLDNVRSDPRFPPLLQEIKTRWENLGNNLPRPLRLQAIAGRTA
jgi:tetratricopeptide (TPR) repeat protein